MMVLLIDDDRDNVEICSALLEHHGFQVMAAGDVAAGVRIACESRPAVVVTELFARTASGWTVLEALRGRPETAGIPIIVLSAHALPADRAAASGAAAFLTKPAYPGHVLEHVRRVCAAAA
ncbi:MAG: response regulator [Gemmatimonadetes bacterium]|nr:response regulator [Gemmatimonadota bacterium]